MEKKIYKIEEVKNVKNDQGYSFVLLEKTKFSWKIMGNFDTRRDANVAKRALINS